MSNHCPAPGCTRKIPIAALLACQTHWSQLGTAAQKQFYLIRVNSVDAAERFAHSIWEGKVQS